MSGLSGYNNNSLNSNSCGGGAEGMSDLDSVLNWVRKTDSFTRVGLVKAIFFRMTLDELKRARCALKHVASAKAKAQRDHTTQVKEHERHQKQEEKKLEVRSHGVGYFGFAKDEEARGEQLKELRKLSEQTGATRAKLAKEKTSKKAAMSERLKKIRAKQRAKRGLPPEEEKSEDEDEGAASDEDKETNEEKKDSGEAERRKEMRPWDFGKSGVFGPRPSSFDELDEKWLKDRRSDRLPEFAPPSNLYSQGGIKRAYYSGSSSSSTNKPSATATSSSTATSTSSNNPYSNFVRGESHKEDDSSPPPPSSAIPAEPFKAPSQFWKKSSSSSYSSGQKPVPIVDECVSAPVAAAAGGTRSSFFGARDDNKSSSRTSGSCSDERGRGTEIAPPPTFDYYHGGGQTSSRGGKRTGGSGIKEEIMAQAVSSGLRTLREKFEAQERKKKKQQEKMSEEDDKEDDMGE